MTLVTSPHHANRTGRIQGGVLCTLLDAVAGYAGLYVEHDQPARESLTLSLTSNFLASGVGHTLVAEGFIERQGASIYFARSEVRLDGSLLLATAVGTFKYRRASGTGSRGAPAESV
jgi:acyl-coenzyme A thioesterase PaaI-like protein